MLQIKLKGPSSEGGGGAKPIPVDYVTVACPDHLVLADLPVAKSLGSATAASLVKTVGRRSRRQLGERVHFCVRCDFPIAIYGRLSPCDHAFCLDCARSDSICYLCDERIQKIQTIKMMEGIFICAAPHCLKSFLKKTEFEFHIHETHTNLLQPNMEKGGGNELEAISAKQSTAYDSTACAPPMPVFSPNSNSQAHDSEDKALCLQPTVQPPPRSIIQPKHSPPPLFGQILNHPSEQQQDNNRPQGFDRTQPHNLFHQQNFDMQGALQHEYGQPLDKQQRTLSDTPFPEYPPMHAHQPPNFAVPVNSTPPSFSYPPFPPEGAQPFYSAPYEMARPDTAPELFGSAQGSLLGFPPGGVNFSESYHRPWNMAPAGVPFGPPAGQGIADGFHGDYGRNPVVSPSNLPPPPTAHKGIEPARGGNAMDPRDGKGILAPPPPPPRPHLSQLKRGKFYPGEMDRDGQGFVWQHEKRDSFGSGQD
uniref:RING-type E3 ubiquitin transferase n=1 Tax=Davidia involucrata TaxID=16924 RepID=A0A5B6ZLJ0_DAVIN